MKKSKTTAGSDKKTNTGPDKKTKTGPDKNNNEKISTPCIYKFFKSSAPSAPKLREAGKNDKLKDNDETKAVYTDLLKQKLRDLENGNEAVEREGLQNEMEPVGPPAVVMEKAIIELVEAGQTSQCTGCKDWEGKYKNLEKDHITHITECKDGESKYKNLKKDYMKLATKFAELRVEHDDLLKTKTYTHINQSDINSADDVVSSSDGIFTSNEVAVLQNMPLDQQTDSTFILKCLKFAYKNDTSVLRYRTLKGKPEVMVVSDDGDVAYMPGKDPLSPLKIKLVRSLFVERINKCNLKPDAYDKRMKDAYMNKLVASSITNIGKHK